MHPPPEASNLESPAASEAWDLFGLRLDRRVAWISIASTLLLTVDHYHRFLPGTTLQEVLLAKALERNVYYLIIPLLIVVFVFRDRPSEYGLTLGDWRQGLKWTAVVILAAVPILYIAARTPALVDYYARAARAPLEVVFTSGLDLFGWEFLFRGFILFGLLRILGPSALVLQAVPFALAHLGKPELETITTMFGGMLFGWVAWRGRSFVYAFLIHWFINVFVILTAMSAAR